MDAGSVMAHRPVATIPGGLCLYPGAAVATWGRPCVPHQQTLGHSLSLFCPRLHLPGPAQAFRGCVPWSLPES